MNSNDFGDPQSFPLASSNITIRLVFVMFSEIWYRHSCFIVITLLIILTFHVAPSSVQNVNLSDTLDLQNLSLLVFTFQVEKSVIQVCLF